MAYKRGVIQGLGQGAGTFGIDDVYTEAMRRIIEKKAYDHAALAIGTTKDVLQGLIEKAITEGQGIEELGRAIRGEFDGMSRVRGLRIARTETTDTVNDGTLAALVTEGAQHKEWSTVIDGRERPEHASANGQIVPIDSPFHVGGESGMYPGDDIFSASNRVNCRCAVLAAGLPEDRRTQLGDDFLRAQGSLERRFMVDLRSAFLEQRDRILSRLSP